MKSHLHLKEVVHAVAERIGVPIDAADDQFILAFDGIYECSFTVSDDANAIEFSTPLCLVGADRERLFEQALRLNLHAAATRGAAISLHSDASVLVLRVRQRAGHLDAQWLSQTLMEIVDTARTIRRELHDVGVERSAMPQEFTPSINMIRA
jgi:hypothetical protein